MVSVTVPNAIALTGNTSVYTGPMTYVFDAVFKLSHEQRVEKTRHPVQTGADINSHAYLQPAQLTLMVGMSDVMQGYVASSQQVAPITPFQYPNYSVWTGAGSRSISAYVTMLRLQRARQPLVVTTRLRTYSNMLITNVAPDEDHTTITGLRMRVEFEEIITAAATITNGNASARTNDTGSTSLGQVNAQAPDSTTTSQYKVTSQNVGVAATDSHVDSLITWLKNNPSGVDTPGAGDYSSYPVTNLANTSAPSK